MTKIETNHGTARPIVFDYGVIGWELRMKHRILFLILPDARLHGPKARDKWQLCEMTPEHKTLLDNTVAEHTQDYMPLILL